MFGKLLLALCAALTLASAAPAPKQPAVPIDAPARAKFPKDAAGLIDGISFINRSINAAITPMSDDTQYGGDLWVMMPESMAGDCEDFVLTKYAFLGHAGFPPMLMRLVGVVVHKKDRSTEGHAILELILPSGRHAFLDNLSNDLTTRKELEARGYEFVDWGD